MARLACIGKMGDAGKEEKKILRFVPFLHIIYYLFEDGKIRSVSSHIGVVTVKFCTNTIQIVHVGQVKSGL